MKRRWSLPASGFVIGIGTLALSFAPSPQKNTPFILAPDEGDIVGSHHIKADPQTGAKRLAVGLTHFKGGNGIGLHMHEREDEILFVHSGVGLGVVGSEVKSVGPGTTLYIPQGTWHGIESRGEEMEVLWVVSPPEFANYLRDAGALQRQSRSEKLSEKQIDEIAMKHGYRGSEDFFAPRLSKSRWNGGPDWGPVVFSQAGTDMQFSRNGVPGHMEIQADFPAGLAVQGKWALQSGEEGPFALFFDFATGSKITVKWGPKLERSSDWTLIEPQK